MTVTDCFYSKFSCLTSPPTHTASYNTGPTLLWNNTAPTLHPTRLRQHCCPAILRHTKMRQHCFQAILRQHRGQHRVLQHCTANTTFVQHCTKTAFYSTAQSLLSNNTAPIQCFPTTLHQHCLLQYCANTASYNITLRQYCANTASYNNAPALHYTSGCDKTRTQRRILECPARQTKQRFITQGHENQGLITNTRQNEKITKLTFRALALRLRSDDGLTLETSPS